MFFSFFFFNDTAPPEIYPLPLHDALPISPEEIAGNFQNSGVTIYDPYNVTTPGQPASPTNPRLSFANDTIPTQDISTDRKSTRLNSSHGYISYAVFCLKKKKPA